MKNLDSWLGTVKGGRNNDKDGKYWLLLKPEDRYYMSELMMNTIKDGRRHLDPKGTNEMQQRGPETVEKRLV